MNVADPARVQTPLNWDDENFLGVEERNLGKNTN